MKLNNLRRLKSDMMLDDIKTGDLYVTGEIKKTSAYLIMKKDAEVSLQVFLMLVKALKAIGFERPAEYWTDIFIGEWDK
jgi:hypothetical protein